MTKKLLSIGCGKMGGALLTGLVKNGWPGENIMAVEPSMEQATEVKKEHGITLVPTQQELPTAFTPDIIMFAVKPQLLDEVLKQYQPSIHQETIAISIAAGKTMKDLEQGLGSQSKIIRTMPNLPATVGQGATVAYANSHVTDDDKQHVTQILNSIGQCFWLTDESLMDAVTAVSGSGPAYLFHVAECMTQAAIAQGLPAQLATDLTNATLLGSANLLVTATQSATELREAVTSPNGTTAAALQELMADDQCQQLFGKAIAAATKRSKEL